MIAVEPKARIAAASFQQPEWSEFEKRRKLFGGEIVAGLEAAARG